MQGTNMGHAVREIRRKMKKAELSAPGVSQPLELADLSDRPVRRIQP
jgi:hypothetical protein